MSVLNEPDYSVNCEVMSDLFNILSSRTDNLESLIPFIFASKATLNHFQRILKHCSTISTTTFTTGNRRVQYNANKLGVAIFRPAILHAPVVLIDGLVPDEFHSIFKQRKELVHVEYLAPLRHGLQLSVYPVVSSIKIHGFNDKVHQLLYQCPHIQDVEFAMSCRSRQFIFPSVEKLTLDIAMPLTQYRENPVKSISSATRSVTIKNANPRIVVPLSDFTDYFSLSIDQLTINLEFHKNYYSNNANENFVHLASTFPDEVRALIKESNNTENQVNVLYRWNMLNRSSKVALTNNFVDKIASELRPHGFQRIKCNEPYGIAFMVAINQHVKCTIVIICYYEFNES